MSNHVHQFITSSTHRFNRILNHVNRLEIIQKQLQHHAAPEFCHDLRVANYRNGCLIVEFSNSALATKFRYQIPMLLQQLRQQTLPDLVTIKSRVHPKTVTKPSTNRPYKPIMTQASGEMIRQAARYVADPKLAKALKRLSENGQS